MGCTRMGIDKQGTKGGNYVGGFLQMFDWNAKSRKKLFSSKSDVPEQSKQKKTRDGNFPKTRLHMLDTDENAGGSSVKGSSDQSCSSSVIDDDFCGTKAPGVVARLMGLDSLPKSSMPEPFSGPLFGSHESYYQTKSLHFYQDQSMNFSSLQDVPRIDMQPKFQKVIHRPIEKFQTEILPPKSAKSIPITHHKLLSPIKSASFIPPKDAAQIMEAAARIIDPGPHERRKMKQSPVGSSSVPLRVRDLKQKAEAAQKPLKVFEGSQRKAEFRAAKNIKGQSMNKSWNGSGDAVPHSEESVVNVKNKGKSISLALQAKANVQKREGLNVKSSRNLAIQKEPSEHSPKNVFKSQSTAQKSVVKKPSLQNGSSVLRQNNQKQNCIVDRGKSPSNSNSRGGKTLSKESSSVRQRNSSKLSSSSKVSSRKLSSEVRDDKREVLSSSTERVTSKKRSADGNYHSGKIQMDKNGKAIQSRDIMDRQSSCSPDSGMTGIDVVSFTFTSPMTRLEGSGRPTEAGETCKIFSAGYQSKRSLLNSDGTSPSRFSHLGHNVKGGDALNILLEQKLKELAHKVEFSQQKSGAHLHDNLPNLEGNKARDGMHTDYQVVVEEMSSFDSNISQAQKLIDCHNPSPVSVLEHSPFAESCNSSDTAETNSSTGSKQFSSVQAPEITDSYSLNTFLGIEGDTELSDSASSNLPKYELEYVKEMLCNIELMFKDYALGRSHKIIKPPHLYNQDVHMIDQRLMFDCVGECLDLRCRQYVSGGYRLWAKGVSVVRSKDRLAKEVYKEISGWSSDIGESMIDELVDKDMSNQRGRWLDFDTEAFEVGIQIESRILNSLIDEVIADILMQ